ncbi:PLP-dependent aminotransferase family protein [Bifidobacterium crudilactis]|uniref:aminotransferase-like domain-containing protein n=1 Tax=Bifidobacterium crudilactis TaxID=327277 RepID=UPI00264801FC|nr:PLP-dependent aminotransferase family protein [Bifidobacterium crudilactis]MDN6016805.1 PLP-dependent aminotransferase family protein [Bifidobacterium mongoliense]MDN6658637.1 PLP-dependent aminotransferase family protein [Acidipropionibacterium jensenii]MDN5972971.1 PLP-dependent aminotransferase family protein [Bifidobacterium crudilactis]MDN6210507.1 PLP-dependent aminotransferase family protein [Bifidobacterium crudilactis]MDN6467084.1 PLP-dependent aminotransferase family protein [Bifi
MMDQIATFPLSQAATSMRPSPVRDLLNLISDKDTISFAGGLPDPAFFDAPGIRECFDRVLEQMPERALQYSSTEGEPELRRLAAQKLCDEGVQTGPDDVLVTTGSQQALSIIAAALVSPGDVVLVEAPTYLAMLQAFELAGARLVSVPTDTQGVLPDALDRAIRVHHPKCVYLIPTFQNPTGRTVPESRREKLASVIARHDVVLVEDDPYSQLRFSGDPLLALSGRSELAGRTILLNTLSKGLAPGLRVGWLRAPAPIRRTLAVIKQAYDLHTSPVVQLAAAQYLQVHQADVHRLDPVRHAYQRRAEAMTTALQEALPAGSTMSRPEGGMFVWVHLPDGWDAEALLPHAISRKVAFVPGISFYADNPDRATLRLSFCTYSPDVIREGVGRLHDALRAYEDVLHTKTMTPA